MFGLVGALADESSNDGLVNVSVNEGDRESLVKLYKKQLALKNVNVQTSLVRTQR